MPRQALDRTRDQRMRPTSGRQTTEQRGQRRWLLFGAALGVVAIIAAALYLGAWNGGSQQALSVLRTDDLHALALSPDNPNTVFFGHHNGIMRSDDGGRTWHPVVALRNFDAMGIAVSHADPKHIYVTGHDVFQVSMDGGATWQPAIANLPGTDIHALAMSPTDPNHLYAFVVGVGAFESVDGGRTWQRLPGQLPPDVMALAASTDALFAGSLRSGLLRSSDGGKSWEPATSGLDTTYLMALAAPPTAPSTVYAGTDTGLFRSTDSGTTWSKLPFPGQNVVSLAVSRSDPDVLMAVERAGQREGRVYRSEDGGMTWGDQ